MLSFLVSEELLKQKEQAIREVTKPVSSHYVVDADDPVLGFAFRAHLLFSDSKLIENVGIHLRTSNERFYNRYYWFLVLTKLIESKSGPDSSLHQQAFKILEEEGDLDWNIVEELPKLAEDTARRLV